MTDENRVVNRDAELARAAQALQAAEALFGLGLHADSVSRAYYAVFHLIRAMLVARGIEARTHAGVVHLFHAELVRSGAFPPTHGRAVSGLQRHREVADYDAAALVTEADARGALDEARGFEAATRAMLAAEP